MACQCGYRRSRRLEGQLQLLEPGGIGSRIESQDASRTLHQATIYLLIFTAGFLCWWHLWIVRKKPFTLKSSLRGIGRIFGARLFALLSTEQVKYLWHVQATVSSNTGLTISEDIPRPSRSTVIPANLQENSTVPSNFVYYSLRRHCFSVPTSSNPTIFPIDRSGKECRLRRFISRSVQARSSRSASFCVLDKICGPKPISTTALLSLNCSLFWGP